MNSTKFNPGLDPSNAHTCWDNEGLYMFWIDNIDETKWAYRFSTFPILGINLAYGKGPSLQIKITQTSEKSEKPKYMGSPLPPGK